MNNKGFTTIEMVVVLLIIGTISGIALVSYDFFHGVTEDRYYRILKNNLLLAGSDYFENHRGDFLGTTLTVSIDRLVTEGYIEEVKDSNNNVCEEGYVIKYKGNDNKFHYDLCMICGSYISYNDYCE